MQYFTLPPAFHDFSSCSPFEHFVEAVERKRPFPSYNIEKVGSDSYKITLSVPGFREKDLSIMLRENVLIIKGHKEKSEKSENKSEKGEYLYQDFSQEDFEKSFRLENFFIVQQATLDNGLLTIKMVREIPEEKKAKRIDIQCINGDEKSVVEEQKSALLK